ncbi:MAG: 2-oxo acid dehydrogenase subunit E2 [Verrucomicrobia bacterium]|nr:2-oxo acid dehydrogenase subunit E2 [Verrucomicrobiota bacterium]
MPIEIIIPRLGWSMDEGNFVGWLKQDGEQVKSGEPLFTLESEKTAQDVEATDSGVLRIPKDAPQPGAVVKVGQCIGYLVAENETVESGATPAQGSPAQKEKPRNDSPEVDSVIPLVVSLPATIEHPEMAVAPVISPRARRRAAELGVDPTRLQGSGRTGRIIESDVLKAAASQGTAAIASPARKAAPTSVGQVSIMRRSIAERTALSFSTIPHFYLRAEVDATELVKMREHLLEVVERECGVRVTVTDFLLRAQALALRDFPAANAVWQENGIEHYADADVGVVVGLPDGLLIPVIRTAQKLSLVQLAKERARLVEAVRTGRFNAEMLAGGATSISNLGTTRTDEFAAVIAPHQSSMLAVGRAIPRPYVVEGRLEIRTTIWLCLSVDHRVLDGGPAAEFLGRIVELLEAPKALVDDGARH